MFYKVCHDTCMDVRGQLCGIQSPGLWYKHLIYCATSLSLDTLFFVRNITTPQVSYYNLREWQKRETSIRHGAFKGGFFVKVCTPKFLPFVWKFLLIRLEKKERKCLCFSPESRFLFVVPTCFVNASDGSCKKMKMQWRANPMPLLFLISVFSAAQT